MRMRIAVITLLLLAPAASSGLAARETDSASRVESQQLFVKPLAADPSKEVNAQTYTFAPGAVLPWHIHPDADEIAYIIEGTFTFQRAGEQPKVLHDAEARHVHSGLEVGQGAAVLHEQLVEQEPASRIGERPEHEVVVCAHVPKIGDHLVTCQRAIRLGGCRHRD